MIKSISISRFLSFRELPAPIDLEKGENVLVGINGSGKSNLFKAIKLLKEGIAGIGYEKQLNHWGGLNEIKHRGKNGFGDFSIRFQFYPSLFDGFKNFRSTSQVESIGYTLKVLPNSESKSGDFEINEELFLLLPNDSLKYPLAEVAAGHCVFYNSDTSLEISNLTIGKKEYELKRVQNSAFQQIKDPSAYQLQEAFTDALGKIKIYSYFNTSAEGKLRDRSKYDISDRELSEDGLNLNSVLKTIQDHNPFVFEQIKRSLVSVNEHYAGIEIIEESDGKIKLNLLEAQLNSPTSNVQISDGTLRFLCLMTIFYNPNRGPVICIDEPELGLHPDMLLNLRRAIEFAAQTSQIIIATHSSLLLNLFEIENIIVFEKSDANGTVVNKFTSDQFEKWKGEFLPGDLWNNGHLGGTRW
jgi:predicted ATPase